jgi:hypothetical protein
LPDNSQRYAVCGGITDSEGYCSRCGIVSKGGLGFRNKGWSKILGFIIALAAFYVLHPSPMRVTSIGGSIGAFYALLPYTFPSVALA